jgi:hypothetical protein
MAMIGFLQRAIGQLRRVISPEPKNRGGRPKKYATVEERRAADAEYARGYRKRVRQKKAEQRTVGQLVKQQDSAGQWHFYLVQAIDAEGHTTKREEIALDENGKPRKWANGHLVFLKELDDVKPPAPKPASSAPPAPASPAPAPAPVVPRKPETPVPPLYDNAAAVIRYYKANEFVYEADSTHFFLIKDHTKACAAGEQQGQHAVTILRWHEAYSELDLFAAAKRIWVLVADASDKAWLQSLTAASPTMLEKMRVAVGDISNAFGIALSFAKLARQEKSSFSNYISGFERSWPFQQMPCDAAQVDKLLQPPPKPEPPQTNWEPDWRMGGSAGSSASQSIGWIPPKTKKPGPDDGSGGNDNDGTQACH